MRGVRGRSVDEPRPRPDGSGNTEGQILGELEGLEVIEDDGLVHLALECGQGPPEQQEGVSAEEGADAGDGRRSAAEGPGQLAVCGAGLEPRGYGSQQLGPFSVVGEGKRPSGEAAAAGETQETRVLAATGGSVRAVLPVAELVGSGVVAAVLSGAEAGSKILHSIDGCARPLHAETGIKPRARRVSLRKCPHVNDLTKHAQEPASARGHDETRLGPHPDPTLTAPP